MRFVKFSCLVALAVVSLADQARADAWDIMVVNSTGKAIRSVELAITPATVWTGINQTETGKTIQNGSRDVAHFDKPNDKCRYDLRAVFSDGGSAVWAKINVCDFSYVTIKYPNSQPTFAAN